MIDSELWWAVKHWPTRTIISYFPSSENGNAERDARRYHASMGDAMGNYHVLIVHVPLVAQTRFVESMKNLQCRCTCGQQPPTPTADEARRTKQ